MYMVRAIRVLVASSGEYLRLYTEGTLVNFVNIMYLVAVVIVRFPSTKQLLPAVSLSVPLPYCKGAKDIPWTLPCKHSFSLLFRFPSSRILIFSTRIHPQFYHL